MRLLPLCLCVVLLTVGWFAGQSRAEDEAKPATPKFEQIQMVLLRRSDKALDVPRSERGALGQQHLEHLRKMGEAGHLLVAGPFGEKDDSAMRGLCLYRVDSMEKARALASQDPAVKAGLFDVVCATWYVKGGTMMFPKASTPSDKPASDQPASDQPAGGAADQSSPKALAESIFAAARSGNLRSLVAIAADGSDGDSKRVAGVAKAEAKNQAEFRTYFQDGKVNGDIVMNGNKASVPILFGPGATRKETFEMIKQADGRWYLMSF